jgi:transcription-repair coupling factor (superfamily II helicase)
MDQDFSQDIKHATVKSFVDEAAPGHQTCELLGLYGSADAYLLAQTLDKVQQLQVLLTADLQQARQLTADLQFYHHRSAEIAL